MVWVTIMANDIQIHRPAGANELPPNALWKNRFEIRSASSNRIYIIAQNKDSGKYGCSCPAYRTRRYCKHLTSGCGLMLSQIHGNAQMEEKKKSGNFE